MGFDPSAVGELVGLSRGFSTCSEVHEVARRQVARLRAEGAGLQSIEAEIARFAARCPGTGSGPDCPILAELRTDSSHAVA